MAEGIQALTEREKQTLRLVVRGHDAKSMARHLGLSVHTINERLRFARRKLAVSSSREAARLLLEREGQHPHSFADTRMGEAAGPAAALGQGMPHDGRRARVSLAWAIGGFAAMSLLLATLALTALPHAPAAPAAAPPANAAHAAPDKRAESTALAGSAPVQAALAWLALLDADKWSASYDATGQSFKQMNTLEIWTSVSEEARPPLGALRSRTPVSQESVPAPPYGYQMIKFASSFANRPEVTETLTLSREGGTWRVVGYVID